jgi:hypothetical protein
VLEDRVLLNFNLARPPFPVDAHPLGVAVADLNGDGFPDLVTVNSTGTVSVLIGNGDGTFQPAVSYRVGANPHAVIVGNFSGSGIPDLAVAETGSNDIRILLGNGDGTFRNGAIFPAGPQPVALAVADFDGDGRLDLIVANHVPEGTVAVLLGDGNGGFGPPIFSRAGPLPSSIAVGDFNGDGYPDVAVSNNVPGPGTVSVLLNRGAGDGTFLPPVPYQTGLVPVAVVAADFIGTGFLDLAVANQGVAPQFAGSVTILNGNPDGTFRFAGNYPVGSGPRDLVVGDVNLDGSPDLVTANRHSNDVSVLLNRGDGTFRNGGSYPAGPAPSSLAVVLNFGGGTGPFQPPDNPWPNVVVTDTNFDGTGLDAVSVLFNDCSWDGTAPGGGMGSPRRKTGMRPVTGEPNQSFRPTDDWARILYLTEESSEGTFDHGAARRKDYLGSSLFFA